MLEREQALDRVVNASAEAEKISYNLRELVKGPIQVDGVTIPQTNRSWSQNNHTAAKKIDMILEDINKFNPEKLTTADLKNLASGLENIAENFRYNTPKNRNPETPRPTHVYDTGNYYNALQNSSVPNSYAGTLDLFASEYIAPLQERFSVIEHETEDEIVFKDSEEETMHPELAEGSAARIRSEELHRRIQEVDEKHKQKKAVEPPQEPAKRVSPAEERNYSINPITPLEIAEENFQGARRGLDFYGNSQKVSEKDRQSIKALLTRADATRAEKTQIDPNDTKSIKDHVAKVNAITSEMKSLTAHISSQMPAAKLDKLEAKRAKLEEAKEKAEEKADGALWDMIITGGALGIAIITGAALLSLGIAVTPVGWGMIGAIAAGGLVSLAWSAFAGNSAEEEADNIQLELDELNDQISYPDLSDRPEAKFTVTPPAPLTEPSLTTKTATGRPPVEAPGLQPK